MENEFEDVFPKSDQVKARIMQRLQQLYGDNLFKWENYLLAGISKLERHKRLDELYIQAFQEILESPIFDKLEK